ncbi:ATP-grasp domain-containing protein [Streptomyces sp. NPDC020403]|uniref:ATP-grasp domain-containing protein n=1 Tax=unclassified Streptomyces TaxID=2593676 RepID=UPI0033FCCD42
MRPLLALAPHRSTTAGLLAGAARERGMDVVVLPRRGVPDRLRERGGAHYFGGPHFASGVVGPLGTALLEPDADWLDGLPHTFTGRRIGSVSLSVARRADGPFFAKPPTDKSFPAAVYQNGSALPEDRALPAPSGDPLVQLSEVVVWVREFRLFLLDGRIRTGSQYATFGRLDAAPLSGHRDEPAVRDFARRLWDAAGEDLPSGVVVDIGVLRRPSSPDAEQWAVVEANMAWFSNVYAAEPARALDVVLRSAGPRTALRARDTRFRGPAPRQPLP